MTGVRRHFYGALLVTLGLWEATSYGSGRVPTITTLSRNGCRRWPPLRLVVIAFLLGAGRHLTSERRLP